MPGPLALLPFVMRIVFTIWARFRALSIADKSTLLLNMGMGADWIYQKLGGGDLSQEINNKIAEEVASRAGIELDPVAPFSDASLANALSAKTGIAIRSLKDRNMIEEDVESFAVARISARLGYPISTIRDVEILKKEVAAIGATVLVERTGLPILPLPDDPAEWRAAIRARVLTWAEAELSVKMSASGAAALAGLQESSVEAVAAQINSGLDQVGSIERRVRAHQVALLVADGLAQKCVQQYQGVIVSAEKLSRKRALGREAQRKFRIAHGNRQKYVPLGMSAVIG